MRTVVNDRSSTGKCVQTESAGKGIIHNDVGNGHKIIAVSYSWLVATLFEFAELGDFWDCSKMLGSQRAYQSFSPSIVEDASLWLQKFPIRQTTLRLLDIIQPTQSLLHLHLSNPKLLAGPAKPGLFAVNDDLETFLISSPGIQQILCKDH